MNYRDLDIWLEGQDGAYEVWASSPPMPPTPHQNLEIDPAEAAGHAEQIRTGDASEDEIRAFGTSLYETLFAGAVGQRFDAIERASDEGRGVRVRLRIGPPELAEVPWEYLCVPDNNFVGTNRKTPLVRNPGLQSAVGSLEIESHLRVLVAIPTATGLNVDGEMARLETALAPLGDTVELIPLKGGVTIASVAGHVNDGIHVFHLVGHGQVSAGTGYVLFDGDHGPEDVSDRELAELFVGNSSVKLVILNACEGAVGSSFAAMAGMARRLVQQRVPAVIAHQSEIEDDAALLFVQQFYGSLCSGVDAGLVDASISNARHRLLTERRDHSFGLPVLYLRATDGRLFVLPAEQSAAGEPPPGRDHATLQLELDAARENRARLAHQLADQEANVTALETKLRAAGVDPDAEAP